MAAMLPLQLLTARHTPWPKKHPCYTQQRHDRRKSLFHHVAFRFSQDSAHYASKCVCRFSCPNQNTPTHFEHLQNPLHKRCTMKWPRMSKHDRHKSVEESVNWYASRAPPRGPAIKKGHSSTANSCSNPKPPRQANCPSFLHGTGEPANALQPAA